MILFAVSSKVLVGQGTLLEQRFVWEMPSGPLFDGNESLLQVQT